MKLKNKIFVVVTLLWGTVFTQNFNKPKLDSLFQILETKNKFMGSIAISEKGKIIYSKSIGKVDIETNINSNIETKYRIGSISKMFTSCMVFKAIEDKKMTLNQTLDKYFPTIENAKKISIGNLLNHRSGIHNFTNDEEYLKYYTSSQTEQQMIEIIGKGKSDFEPNSKGEYSNSNYVLLSYILEKTYKKSFKELLNNMILQPLKLKNTYYGSKIDINNNECFSYSFNDKWEKEKETDLSIPMGAGAIVSNPSDLLKFIESLFVNKIISQKSLEQMKTISENFGMGIFKVPFYDKIGFGHTGGIDGFGSSLSYFPHNNLSIALTANGLGYENNNIIIAALSCYFDKPFQIPTFNSIELKSADLDKYIGEYYKENFPLEISITKNENKLFAQATGQSAFPLDAIGKDKFEFLAANIIIEFSVEENILTINQRGNKTIMKKK